MKIIDPSYEILTPIGGDEMLKMIEKAGRTCYKSEDKITDESAKVFAKSLIARGHEAMIEHFNITVRFICARGFSHELVRHRLASYAQESTRYVGYADKLLASSDMTEREAVELYEEGLSMRRVSFLSKGKFTEWDVYKILDWAEVGRRNPGNKGVIWEDFFDTIDTPEKAYLLGLIQADGSLHKDSYQVSVTQKNGWFVERMIADFIKPSVWGSKDRECKQYSFANKRLYEALLGKGIIPNKSNVMKREEAAKLWQSVPEELKADFVRGFMDGDGSLRFFKQSNDGETDSCNISWNGNFDLLAFIGDWLFRVYKYDTSINLVSGCDNLYRISVTKPGVAERLCKDMYANFKFPYGHPVKTSRAFERIGFTYDVVDSGNTKFKVIRPSWWLSEGLSPKVWVWAEAVYRSEKFYTQMLENGALAQDARGVLPIDLKTEVVITANLREWRHIFKLRTAKTAHPSMRQLMRPLLKEFQNRISILFEDIKFEEEV